MLDAVEDVSCTLMVESDDTRVLFRLLSVPLVFSETGGRTPYRRFRDPGFGDSMREAGALGDGFNVYVLPRILSPDQVAMPLRNRIGILESMVGAVLGQSDEGEAMELVPERDPALVRPTAPGLGYLLILSVEPVGDGVTLSSLTGAPDGWRLFEEYGKWAHSFAPKLSRAVFSGKKAQVTPPDVRIAIPSSVSSANAHGSMLARVVALLPTRSESSRILKEHGGPLDFSVDERPGTGMEPLVRVRARGPDGDVAFERVQAVSYHEGVVEVMAMIALEGAGHKCIRKVETPFAPEAGSSSG